MQPLSQVLPPSATTTPEGHLSIGGCDVVALAAEFGTPLVIYDAALLRDTMRRYVQALRAHDPRAEVVYASKAFWAQALLRMAHEEDLRMDVASGGELFMALHAGFPAEKVVMHGNAKDAREIGEALDAMVGLIVVDSLDEIALLDQLAGERGRIQDVLVRVTPGVKPSTHAYISTGQLDSKFGFSLEGGLAAQAVAACRAAANVNLVGLHCHIGSQIFELGAYPAAEQRAIVAEAMGIWEGALGQPPIYFRPGCNSANDETFGVLLDLGFRGGSIAAPHQAWAKNHCVWTAADPYPHRANLSFRQFAGDSEFVDVPMSVDFQRPSDVREDWADYEWLNVFSTKYDLLAVVWCLREQQVERAVARGVTEERARALLAAQLPLDRKRDLADLVIDNSGSRQQLVAEVDRAWDEIRLLCGRAQ